METIELNMEFTHVAGKYKLVYITDKTKTSVQFKDQKGYVSWIGLDEFLKFFKRVVTEV